MGAGTLCLLHSGGHQKALGRRLQCNLKLVALAAHYGEGCGKHMGWGELRSGGSSVTQMVGWKFTGQGES